VEREVRPHATDRIGIERQRPLEREDEPGDAEEERVEREERAEVAAEILEPPRTEDAVERATEHGCDGDGQRGGEREEREDEERVDHEKRSGCKSAIKR
jgi:hypothetical protein